MASRNHALVAIAALALITGVLGFWRLSDAPIFLGRDEVFVGLSGHALATTGRDLQGHFFPLFVYSTVHGNWWPPILPYAIALVLKLVPLSEAAVRAPMALAAIVTVIAVFFAGRSIFERPASAWISALVLALAPLQIIESRFANDTGLPAMFAAGWALAALSYFRRAAVWKLAAAGAVLGTGCFSYVGAAPLMPLYAAVTLTALWMRRARPICYVAVFAGFAVPVLLGAAWLVRHPGVIETTFLHYQNEQFANLDRSALRGLSTTRRLAGVASLYLQFWNPRVLFMHGAPWLMHSTGRAGVLLVAIVGVLLVGFVRTAARAARDPQALLLVAGFLLAPVPASLVDIDEHTALYATWRAIAILPFGALLTGAGAEYLMGRADGWTWKLAVAAVLAAPLALMVSYGESLTHRRPMTACLIAAAIASIWSIANARPRRVLPPIFIALAVAALLQFQDFYADYLTAYQERFVAETDGNVRDALEAVIDRSPPAAPGRQRAAPAVYLGFRLGVGDWGGYYWRFYVHKRRREDLLARTINDTDASRFDEQWICHLPGESVLATRIGVDRATDARIQSMIARREVVLDALVGAVHGRPTYWLLETTGSCSTE